MTPWDLPDKIRNNIVVTTDGHWLWTGHRNNHGYGVVYKPPGVDKRSYVHRWVITFDGRPIPDDMCVDHLCRVVRCCNPEHLEIVTPRENGLRIASGYCQRGLSMTNSFVRPTGKRMCRTCNDLRNKARYGKRGDDVDQWASS